MQKLYIALLMVLLFGTLQAQNTYQIIIKDSETKEPLIGVVATIKELSVGATSDSNGKIMFQNIPNGNYQINYTYTGYESLNETIVFPNLQSVATIYLSLQKNEMEEVVITSTRSTRGFQDIPTRVEFISEEEIDEKVNMKPGDIRMLLSESTGIQVQTTSATSANASIRIQGLDGRYTQLLKDGFPLYSGASAGLGLLQIPPLDLKQVEVIKGSSSTLYGGGAIAGLVNLITKTPQKDPELSFLLNGTSAGGFDASSFYAQRFGKIGTTVFAAHNRNKAYDPAGIGFSAIPQFNRYTINPRLFIYPNKKTTINFGANTSFENRLGGDMNFIAGRKDSSMCFFEQNTSQRISTQFSAVHDFGKCKHLTFKNSYAYFHRKLQVPDYTFNGIQQATFTELNYANHADKFEWNTGLNLWTDRFEEDGIDPLFRRDYNLNTVGFFAQNSWKTTEQLRIETGLRADYVINYGIAVLPSLSVLYKFNQAFTSRIGGGFGYKPPTLFTEESERLHYRNILPIGASNKIEKSYGANWDINYRKALANNRIILTINHLFFYTYLDQPLFLKETTENNYRFVNINGYSDTKGVETNVKLSYNDLKLFLGYTYTDARIIEQNSIRSNPLTARNRINAILFYEVEEKIKIGLEAYYFSKQTLTDGSTGKAYVLMGFMVEKIWEHFSLYINFENFLDARQTRFDTIYRGTVSNPVFRDIYAPLDGFVFNSGVKVRL